jgi:hypothetical protein
MNIPHIPEDTFTSTKNTSGYYLTSRALKRVKIAAKYANLSWQAIAARPHTAKTLVETIEQEMKK